jgi:hypothetical protein
MVVAMPLSESGGARLGFNGASSRRAVASPATSAMMLAAVTAGVPSAAVRVPSAAISAARDSQFCSSCATGVVR